MEIEKSTKKTVTGVIWLGFVLVLYGYAVVL